MNVKQKILPLFCTAVIIVAAIWPYAGMTSLVFAAEANLDESELEETKPVQDESAETKLVQTEPLETESVQSMPSKTEPVQSEPAQTEPLQSKPVETEPVQSEPAQTLPPQSEPSETEPVQSKPAQTLPPQSNPSEMEPVQSEPAQTEPLQSSPVETEPVQSEPAQTEPPQSSPVETKPVQSEPTQTEPTQSKPSETEPVQSEPAQTEPLQSKPSETEPVQSKPAQTESLQSKPSETEPVQSEPAQTEPLQTKPTKAEDVQTHPAPNHNSIDASYFWDESWYINDFRFTKVEKEYALAEASNGETFVYEAPEEGAKKVGTIPYFGLAFVLETVGEWSYVESGDVRGFVQSEDLTDRSYAKDLASRIGETSFQTGKMLCSKADNEAFTYTYTTTQEVLADKNYAIVLSSGSVYEFQNVFSRTIGQVQSGDLVYLLAEGEDGWLYIESGDVRGFIAKSQLLCGKNAKALVGDIGEADAKLAYECIPPEENKSLYYTLKSVRPASNTIGEQIAEYAASFAGKLAYVWGGTSLTSGADCSGFTQSVYAAFGIRIPRLAQEQGGCGNTIERLSDAKPGDIVYWADGPHVGIYLGNGKVAQCSGKRQNTASNPGKGVTICDATYRPITSIRRYIIQTGVGKNRKDTTNYTQAEMETIWAIVAQEDNGSYEGALAVISSAMNRAESSRWSSLGENALSQLCAPGQYCYSNDRYWIPRLNGNVPDYVKQAVNDCLKKGIRNHSFTSFRSQKGSQTGPNAMQIGGNWFFGN